MRTSTLVSHREHVSMSTELDEACIQAVAANEVEDVATEERQRALQTQS